jgi:phenylacetate-CoA ligase
MSFIDRIYAKSPLLIQNLAVSLKGLQFRLERYGGDFEQQAARLAAAELLPLGERREHQLAALKRFVAHASSTVPHYRKVLAGARPIEVFDDLRRLPVLEKNQLRRDTESFLSEAFDRRSLIAFHTSGTTGTPMTVWATRRDISFTMAALEQVFRWHGMSQLERSIRFSGRTLFPDAEHNKVFWRMNYSRQQMLMSSYNLSNANLPFYAERMEQFKPSVIDGYPSVIYLVARFLLGRGEAGRIRPKLVMTTAETLEDYQRAVIGAAFLCPVVNYYASTEGAPTIADHPSGAMLHIPETGIVEIVRPGTDVPVTEGEVGEFLVTCFNTHAIPLIRYRIGDSGARDPTSRTFRGMSMFTTVIGRQEDYVLSPSRGPVGFLADPVFKKSPSSILECQIVQTGENALDVLYVPDNQHFEPAHLDGIRRELLARVGDMEVKFREMPSILRGPNGKIKAVIGLKSERIT